jgi:cell division protein FtsA
MSSVTELIIGIDLGSTCMTGVLGKRVPGGTALLALSQVPVVSGIRRGVVHNLEEVSRGVQDLLDNLLNKSGYKCKIEQIYIGINGYSIRTIDVTSATTFSGDEILNDIHLDSLTDEVEGKVPDSLDIIDIFPQEFIVDGKVDVNPVGSMPTNVEAHYKVVAGKPIIFRNLDATFDRMHLRYEQILGPMASAEAILVSEDKSRGVVAVDFGAETTSICIYKGNVVRYISILPFGGSNITKDLLQLNIDEDEAEKLKLESGTAIHFADVKRSEDQDSMTSLLKDFEKETNEIMVARVEEIIDNIYAQIRYSGAEIQKLIAGIVITGGASQLPGLDILLSKKTGLAVRIGNPLQNIASKPDEIIIEPGDSLAIGLLLLGKPGCCSATEPVLKPQETQDTVKPQTIDRSEDEEIKKDKPKKNKPKNADKSGGIFSGFIKGLFDEEDL